MNKRAMHPKKTIKVMKTHDIATQLVDGKTLLEILFAKNCRPCLRWLRTQQREGKIPSTKIGRLAFLDPDKVRQALFPQN